MTRARASNPPAPRRISKYLSASSSAELARPAPTTSEASTSSSSRRAGARPRRGSRRPPPADPANRRSASRTREPPSLGTSTPSHVRQVVLTEQPRPAPAGAVRAPLGWRAKARAGRRRAPCGRVDSSVGAVAVPRTWRPFPPRACGRRAGSRSSAPSAASRGEGGVPAAGRRRRSPTTSTTVFPLLARLPPGLTPIIVRRLPEGAGLVPRPRRWAAERPGFPVPVAAPPTEDRRDRRPGAPRGSADEVEGAGPEERGRAPSAAVGSCAQGGRPAGPAGAPPVGGGPGARSDVPLCRRGSRPGRAASLGPMEAQARARSDRHRRSPRRPHARRCLRMARRPEPRAHPLRQPRPNVEQNQIAGSPPTPPSLPRRWARPGYQDQLRDLALRGTYIGEGSRLLIRRRLTGSVRHHAPRL